MVMDQGFDQGFVSDPGFERFRGSYVRVRSAQQHVFGRLEDVHKSHFLVLEPQLSTIMLRGEYPETAGSDVDAIGSIVERISIEQYARARFHPYHPHLDTLVRADTAFGMRLGRLNDIDNQSVTLVEHLVPEAEPVSDRPLIILHERLNGISPLSSEAYDRVATDYRVQFEQRERERNETSELSAETVDAS